MNQRSGAVGRIGARAAATLTQGASWRLLFRARRAPRNVTAQRPTATDPAFRVGLVGVAVVSGMAVSFDMRDDIYVKYACLYVKYI